MTWATITGAGTTTATKFHGDVMNKINNMFGGVDVTDTVSINAAVTWTFASSIISTDGAKHMFGTGSDASITDTGSAFIIDFDEQNAGSKSLDIQSDSTSILLLNDTLATLSVPLDVPDVESTTLSARDGSLSMTIADSTGVVTFAAALDSPTLTTPDIGIPTAGTIDADNVGISNCAIGAEVVTTLTETEEIWIPAGAFISTATQGAEITTREMATNDVNFAYAAYDTAADEHAEFVWTPPANWNAGTVKFLVHWTNTAGLTTETIEMELAGLALADNDALDTAYGTAVAVTDTWIAQNDLHITAQSTAITIAGSPAAGEQVHFKLSRDVSADNLTGDVDVLGVVLEYSVNDIGTT